VAWGALGADTPAQVAEAGAALGPGVGGLPVLQSLAACDVSPIDVPEVLSAAERKHWERTDEIIINVLRRWAGFRFCGQGRCWSARMGCCCAHGLLLCC